MIDRLSEYFARRLAPCRDLRVTALTRMSEGFSQETFRVGVAYRAGEREATSSYVLRRQPAAGLLEPYDTEPEFRVLAALAATPVRAPRVLWYERDPAVLERPFYVMELVPGTVPLPVMVEGRPVFTDTERPRLGEDFVANLAALHAVEWRGAGLEFLGVPDAGTGAAARELARWEDYITRADGPPRPLLTDAILWLRRALPVADAITLVHGDYRTGTFLYDEAGEIHGILDWEMAHLGDPLEDLAWGFNPIWQFGRGLAGGLIPQDQAVAVWRRASGLEADPAALHWWILFNCVKGQGIWVGSARAFINGGNREPIMVYPAWWLLNAQDRAILKVMGRL